MVKNTKVAVSFDEMIQADRKKRKAEELAQQIFGRNRPANTPTGNRRSNNQSPVGGSLASRVGVNKKAPSQQRAASFANDRRQNNAPDRRQPQNQPQSQNLNKSQNSRNQRRPFGDSNAALSSPRPQAQAQAQAAPQTNQAEASFGSVEINIRGAAGPYCVVASNFAPGTTAADIESVMAPIGGEMLGCKLISANPTVIVEMVFVERGGAENVIAMFNNKKADGRILYVYMKEGGPSQDLSHLSANQAHTRPASSAPLAPAPAPAPPAPSPRPLQQPSDDVMEVDPEAIAANDAAYNANAMDEADLSASARPHDNAPPRAPREPRETYRPPPRDERPMYYDDHANNHHGGYGFQDQQQHPRQGGGYGGGYRDDRRSRFRNDGRTYPDAMGRGNGRYRR